MNKVKIFFIIGLLFIYNVRSYHLIVYNQCQLLKRLDILIIAKTAGSTSMPAFHSTPVIVGENNRVIIEELCDICHYPYFPPPLTSTLTKIDNLIIQVKAESFFPITKSPQGFESETLVDEEPKTKIEEKSIEISNNLTVENGVVFVPNLKVIIDKNCIVQDIDINIPTNIFNLIK